MNRFFFLVLAALTIDAGRALHAQTPAPIEAPARIVAQKYTCAMHPEVVMDQPGNCPKCGMELVPKKAMPKSEQEHDGNGRAMHSGMDHSQHVSAGGGMMHHAMKMTSSINLADAMSREGSGTSWLPESSPMYGRMWMFGDDTLMLHGAAFPRYTYVNTDRGDDRIDAPNWIMAMYRIQSATARSSARG